MNLVRGMNIGSIVGGLIKDTAYSVSNAIYTTAKASASQATEKTREVCSQKLSQASNWASENSSTIGFVGANLLAYTSNPPVYFMGVGAAFYFQAKGKSDLKDLTKEYIQDAHNPFIKSDSKPQATQTVSRTDQVFSALAVTSAVVSPFIPVSPFFQILPTMALGVTTGNKITRCLQSKN